MFLEKGLVFGAPLTEEGIAQIYQLIEYLSKSKSYIYMYSIHYSNVIVHIASFGSTPLCHWTVCIKPGILIVKVYFVSLTQLVNTELALGHGLFWETMMSFCSKWTLGANVLVNNLS